jgi:hypothetical protein
MVFIFTNALQSNSKWILNIGKVPFTLEKLNLAVDGDFFAVF